MLSFGNESLSLMDSEAPHYESYHIKIDGAPFSLLDANLDLVTLSGTRISRVSYSTETLELLLGNTGAARIRAPISAISRKSGADASPVPLALPDFLQGLVNSTVLTACIENRSVLRIDLQNRLTLYFDHELADGKLNIVLGGVDIVV